MFYLMLLINLGCLLVCSLAFVRWVKKTEDKIWSMISRIIQTQGELKIRIDDIDGRLGDVVIDVERLDVEATKLDAINGLVAKAREDIAAIFAQLERIDFDSVNKALKAQADFDEGFANIMNYGRTPASKE